MNASTNPGPAMAPPAVHVERRTDGSLRLSNPLALETYPRCLGDLLVRNAEDYPDRIFLGERMAGADSAWRTVTWAEALDRVHRLAEGLLDLGATPERPLVLLSGNSIAHALLTLAAMHVGVPAVPVSVAYSLMSSDFARLKAVIAQVTPGVVFVENAAAFRDAMTASGIDALPIVTRVSTGVEDMEALHTVGDLLDRTGSIRAASPRGDDRFRAIGPDTVAKVLFTSGSTALPKGVVNTHRMLCSNQAALALVWRFLDREQPPVLCDWLPWNHTFGGNFNFNLVLMHAGTLWIDGGKPSPALFDATVANLGDHPPNLYFNVPRGFDLLIRAMESDPGFRDRFFSRLRVVFYAAAALPQDLWSRLERLADASPAVRRPLMVSGWGSTETAPCSTVVHWPIERAGVIGLPLPGTTVALVPNADKLELRVRGPNVTPRYWRDEARTAQAFDDEGFYRIGDAGRLRHPDRPEEGIVFDGRVAEDFKLSSGTWVHAGTLRLAAISGLAPLVSDCVVAGHDRGEVGLLLFPATEACRAEAGLPLDASVAAVLSHPTVRDRIARGLASYNSRNPASSRALARALWLHEPPSIDANEITDKGYINQRAVLARRAAAVDELYSGSEAVILPAR